MNDVKIILADDSEIVISPDSNGNIVLPPDVLVKTIMWTTPISSPVECKLVQSCESSSIEEDADIGIHLPPKISGLYLKFGSITTTSRQYQILTMTQ